MVLRPKGATGLSLLEVREGLGVSVEERREPALLAGTGIPFPAFSSMASPGPRCLSLMKASLADPECRGRQRAPHTLPFYSSCVFWFCFPT